MLELSRARHGVMWGLSFGGDTLNTAIHMARAGHDVRYLTAIGDDALSADLRTHWAEEGLNTSLVLTHPTRNTGLYAIANDHAGERTFSYWRDTSAARDMFSLPEIAPALKVAETAGLLGFSLISLAILPPEGRAQLLALAKSVRANGGRVVFDGNYRPRLWNSVEEACAARDAAISVCDIGLPTLEDERLLSGNLTALDVASHWRGLGCAETLVKLGAEGCLLPDGEIVAPAEVMKPVDTSGAGDAFNGGYLSSRLTGADIREAALAGHALAGWTIMRQGAIPSRET